MCAKSQPNVSLVHNLSLNCRFCVIKVLGSPFRPTPPQTQPCHIYANFTAPFLVEVQKPLTRDWTHVQDIPAPCWDTSQTHSLL